MLGEKEESKQSDKPSGKTTEKSGKNSTSSEKLTKEAEIAKKMDANMELFKQIGIRKEP